jgi:hypothetical protein
MRAVASVQRHIRRYLPVGERWRTRRRSRTFGLIRQSRRRPRATRRICESSASYAVYPRIPRAMPRRLVRDYTVTLRARIRSSGIGGEILP